MISEAENVIRSRYQILLRNLLTSSDIGRRRSCDPDGDQQGGERRRRQRTGQRTATVPRINDDTQMTFSVTMTDIKGTKLTAVLILVDVILLGL